jgi:hypothetical protein
MHRALGQWYPRDVVPARSHEGDGGVVVGVFELDLVWDELVVEAGTGEGLGGGKVLVEDVPCFG